MTKKEQEFEKSRKLYPGTKRGFETEFNNFKKHKDWKQILPLIYDSIIYQIEIRNKSTGWMPDWAHFRTWINQRRWEDEMQINKNESKSELREQKLRAVTEGFE